ncbi:Ceramidase [Penicillium bovifimosum]|uniref:Ceramidase n=1 Tax=Penicillium bovifimosum TaxID=126998 RepID=A0A9W9H4S2_9EURO|nr:Ceramidase [Penicillium bovifimosum]KAJ5138662.1 Ceramidase [Penicillium bovifimosum]
MTWSLPFFPYPPAKDGYWEPVTSTLNWCEEDYYATPYAAEIVNTLTNLLFMWLGVQGILSCRRNGHDQIFTVALLGYLVVGTGSFLFHSTLKCKLSFHPSENRMSQLERETDPMQLVDELSMIYTTCLMTYASFSYSRTVTTRVILAVSLTGLAVFITLYYHYLQDPVFHQNAYALLTTVVVFRSMYTMEKTLRPKWRHSTEADRLARQKKGLPVPTKERQHYENVRDEKTLKTMWFMVIYGLSMFLGGFFIWNLDNVFCGQMRRMRRAVGLPWGIFLEGHGWWHIMTGIGAYLYITWGIWLRHCLNNKQEDYHLRWAHFWRIPEVIRTSGGPSENGVARAKKST